MKNMFYFYKDYSLACWSVLVLSVVVCICSKTHGHLSNSSTLYVDCTAGNDTADCGVDQNTPCKTLQFVISDRVQLLKTSHIVIYIVSEVCNEKGVLRLDEANTKISRWSFFGSNMTSSSTIVKFSMESFNSVIRLTYLKWQNSSGQVSFNVHMSKVSFQHCTFDHVHFQFSGLNTHLLVQNTAVTSCESQSTAIPLFLLQTLYNYDSSMFIGNSTFSHNKSPIIYATQLQEIFIKDTLFLKNGKDVISNSSLVTVSGLFMVIENSIFNQNLGRSIEVENVKNFNATKVIFLLNNGSTGSCLLINRHSNVSLMETIFKQNTNPVVFVQDDDGVNILLKKCTFGCIMHKEEMNVPFLKSPEGTNITTTNCSVVTSCSVHCKNGELVESHLFCKKCQAGSFSHNGNNVILADSCQSCPAGAYTFNTGRTNCSLCAEGTYAQKTGNKGCKKCTNDFFTSDSGASSCSKMTLEFILLLTATIPLIVIPLFLLLCRLGQVRSLKLKARLQLGPKYDRFGNIDSPTTAQKEVLSQTGPYSSY